jgi:4-hydroxybenzoate polyprenyltransferase
VPILKKIFDLFLFSSLFIALCAVVMVNQTYILIIQKPADHHYLFFVFFSTVCSYNFHWMLTPRSSYPSFRLNWSVQHKGYHLFLFLAGLLFSAYFFLYSVKYWLWFGVAVIITFLYSAQKISFHPFTWLKKNAVGKTIPLALVWTYVTAILPLIIENISVNYNSVLFCSSQFFFIFSICILFDYRDREDDKAEGIRSLITYLNERGINILFTVSIILSVLFIFLMIPGKIPFIDLVILLIPVLLIAFLFKQAKKNFSDYFYYFILDGLMMLPGILFLIMKLF